MHCLSLQLRSLAPCSPQAVGRASLRCRDFPFCPAFSCDPVDSSHNLWKVLWPDDRCWEVFKGKRCLVIRSFACLLALHGCGVQSPGVAHISTLQASPAHVQVTAVDS